MSYSLKYLLAVVEVLLKAFGAGIGGGYNIGCKFKTTLDCSRLGLCAWAFNYQALVNSFHGHVHNWLCQLSFLTTYVKGMGLEDLEGCEHFFSKCNVLAPSLHYASIFHWQRKIVEFMKHMDNFETYTNLSKHSCILVVMIYWSPTGNFLVNNYQQALKILQGESALKKSMADLEVTDMKVFAE